MVRRPHSSVDVGGYPLLERNGIMLHPTPILSSSSAQLPARRSRLALREELNPSHGTSESNLGFRVVCRSTRTPPSTNVYTACSGVLSPARLRHTGVSGVLVHILAHTTTNRASPRKGATRCHCCQGRSPCAMLRHLAVVVA